MVSIEFLIQALKEHGEHGYCDKCEADEPGLFYDPDTQTFVCTWCKKSLKWDSLIEQAKSFPSDYLERMIALPPDITYIENIGDDVWVTDCRALAEKIRSDSRESYLDREKFTPTNGLGKLVTPLLESCFAGYEEAKLSEVVYRKSTEFCNGEFFAELKSNNYVAYLNNDYTKYFGGVFVPWICGDLTKPILIRRSGELLRLIMPVRFNPQKSTI